MRKFSLLESNSYSNDEIEDFFIDLIDNEEATVNIIDGFVHDKRFFTEVGNVNANTIKAKKVSLVLNSLDEHEEDSIYLPSEGRTFNNIDVFINVLNIIKKFYARSKKEILFTISPEYSTVIFLLLGEKVDLGQLSDKSKIDDLLNEFLLAINTMKRIFGLKAKYTNNNFLGVDFRTKANTDIFYNAIRKLSTGQQIMGTRPDGTQVVRYGELTKAVKKILDSGFNIKLGYYDYQVVISLKR
jgi:hypothetical protein